MGRKNGRPAGGLDSARPQEFKGYLSNCQSRFRVYLRGSSGTATVGRRLGRSRLRAFVRLERGEPAVAPAHALGDLLGIERLPLRQNALEIFALIDCGIGGAQPAETRAIALAIIRNPGRRVELDRLERTHERPPQAEPALERLLAVLARDRALDRHDERHGAAHRL